MSLDVHTSLDRVRDLVPQWEALFAESLDPSPFLEPQWLINWWEAFSERDWEMRFLTAHSAGELRGVAPLLVRRRPIWGRQGRVVEFWANPYSNHANILVSVREPQDTVAAIAAGIESRLGRWDLVALGPVVLDNTTTRLLGEAFESGGSRYAMEGGHASPLLRLPESWNELESSLGRRYRSSLRRKVRRAAKAGVEYEILTDAACVADVVAVSQSTWQYASGTAIASDPRVQRFYERAAVAWEGVNGLQIALLRVDGKPVAFEYNLRRAGTVYNLKIGYDQAARNLSPGVVLRCHVLEAAIADGATHFDFLGTTDQHKLHWTSSSRAHGTIMVSGPGVYWNTVHRLRYQVRPWLKRRTPWLLRAKAVATGLLKSRRRKDASGG